MRKFFLGTWRFIQLLARALIVTFQLVVGAVFFFGAAAELTSLLLNHGSFVMENVRNLTAIIAQNSDSPPPDEVAKAPAPAGPNCVRFEKKLTDLRCEEKENPADRLLCKITVPPTESVCVEYEPRT